jgi:hypothetical protein
MSTTPTTFDEGLESATRGKPGPKGRWMQQAAKDLGVTLPHLYRVQTGERISATLSRRIAEWKAAHLPQPEDLAEAPAPQPTPSQAIGLTEAERMILIRALTASAEKWRGMAERLRFESEGTVWSDAAYAAEKLLLKIAP